MREIAWKAEPSERELLLLFGLSAVLFAATTVALHGNYLIYGDNGAYVEVAAAIRHWDFGALTDIQHFMGYPYAVAALSLGMHIPVPTSLLVVSIVASLACVLLAARLYGTWVAGYFAVANFAWLQASFFGGSEPLAVALALAAFWSFRREKAFLAALLGSLATVVRPLMICTLLGIGLVLLYRRRYREFLGSLGIGLAIGFLYVLPLAHYFGDPLLTAHSYMTRDYGAVHVAGPHGHLFSWPFYAIVAGTLAYPSPWTNLLLSFFWIALVLAGTGALFARDFRGYVKANPAEVIFCGLYLLMVFCYGYLIWARSNFMRFSIPALPILFCALLRWLPKDRRVLWGIGIVAPVLAGCSIVGIHNLTFPR